jgi:hypothetical protein
MMLYRSYVQGKFVFSTDPNSLSGNIDIFIGGIWQVWS